MLQDASPRPYVTQRRREAPPVVADLVTVHRLIQRRQRAPASTGRVSDHSMRASVEASVALLVPDKDTGQVRVDAFGIDVQRRDGLSGPQVLLTPVVYFGDVASEDIHSRVAVNTEQIRSLRGESDRMRERLHELESDRATLRLVVQQVRELTEQMPNLARRAAREAVDEYLRRRHADTLSNWRTYAALLGAGAALGALIVGLVLR